MDNNNLFPVLIYNQTEATSVQDQCDCACAVATLPQQTHSANPIPTTPHTLNPHFRPLPVTETYQSTLLPHLPNPILLNHPALAIANHFQQPNYLNQTPSEWTTQWGNMPVQTAISQMTILGLLRPLGYAEPTLTESPTTLSTWLHITDRCNLRCSYCYLPHHRVDMSLETGKTAIDATFRSAIAHNYKQIKLKYAGGEAMLRFPLIIDLHQHAQHLADRHNLKLDGIILSNGTRLTPQIIKTIQTAGLRLMISLDGLGDIQDRQRIYANGRDSSADVEKAIDLALENGLIPDVSVTVSGRTAEGLPELMNWLLERDLPFSLNFYRENDLSASHKDLMLEEETIINGMLAAFKVIETNLPRQNLLASLIDRANLSAPHLRTCSVGNSYLVFDHLGQVSKCQMQIGQPVATAKTSDPLALIRADTLGIQNISVEEKEGCQDCEWKYWCTGGCPLATHRATGRYDVKSPNCNIYKTLYPHAVRLEGLRLLKYANGLN